MRPVRRLISGVGSLLFAAALCGGPLDTQAIERATGVKGTWNEKEKVFKVSLPRVDLPVTVGGVRVTPALGLTCWAAFEETLGGTMVMGDLVLGAGQVDAVMDAALRSGLEVTALHNHFIGEEPRVLFMHIGGMGSAATLASGVGAVFDEIRKPAANSSASARIDPATTSLDPAKIQAILGVPGDLKDGVYKVVIGSTTKMHGGSIGAAMGVNTWAAFAGSDSAAVVDGDFAMRESELQGVLKALRAAGISIVAIHNHMTGEEPRVLFLHYWGIGSTESLSRGLKAALETQHP